MSEIESLCQSWSPTIGYSTGDVVMTAKNKLHKRKTKRFNRKSHQRCKIKKYWRCKQ